MHVEITLVKGLWLTSCSYASGPAGLLSMKLLKCEVYLSFSATQYSTKTHLEFKDIITVILDLIVFSGISYVLISQQLSDWCICDYWFLVIE